MSPIDPIDKAVCKPCFAQYGVSFSCLCGLTPEPVPPPAKVVSLQERAVDLNGIAKALLEVGDRAASLDGVIVLALDREGCPSINSSNMSGVQKAYLASYLSAWITNMFSFIPQEKPK